MCFWTFSRMCLALELVSLSEKKGFIPFVLCNGTHQEWPRWPRWLTSGSRSWRTRSTVWCWSTPWTLSRSCCPSSSQVTFNPNCGHKLPPSGLLRSSLKPLKLFPCRYQNLCNHQDVGQSRCGGGLEEPQLHLREDERRDPRNHPSAAAHVLGWGRLGQ